MQTEMRSTQKYSVAYIRNTKFIEVHGGLPDVERTKGRGGA
jgi:hypothetical protein